MTWFFDKAFLEKLDLESYDPAQIAMRADVPLETARAFVDPKRRYRVQSAPEYGWLVGLDDEKRPTLLLMGRPESVDDEDLYVGTERLVDDGEGTHELTAVSFDLKTGEVITRAMGEGDEAMTLDEVIYIADSEIGFEQQDEVEVLAFKHPTYWHFAVVPFSWNQHEDIVGASEDPDLDLLRSWIVDGNFVLHCGNAYDMNEDGEVESS